MNPQGFLLPNAKKDSIEALFLEPVATQLDAYRAALREIDDFLDAGDLTKVTFPMWEILKNDVLDIMTGLRQIREKHPEESLDHAGSIDGALTHLRTARVIIFNAEDYFEGDILIPSSKADFYDRMVECQTLIEQARDELKRPEKDS